MDKLLNLIGLAKKAGKLEVGEEPVGAAARSKHARLILIASDAADNTRRRALHFGEAGECICLEIPPTKDDLGRALGRTSCALLALTDIGFAEAVAKKLAEADEAHYGEAAKRLTIKAARAAERRKELKQHEKRAHRQEKAASGRAAAVRCRRQGKERGKERKQAPERRGQARTHARRAREGAPRRGKAARGKALCPRPPREEGQGQHQERQ